MNNMLFLFMLLLSFQNVESIDVYCFGQLLYEMTFGVQLNAATCDNYRADCSAELSKYSLCKYIDPKPPNFPPDFRHPLYRKTLSILHISLQTYAAVIFGWMDQERSASIGVFQCFMFCHCLPDTLHARYIRQKFVLSIICPERFLYDDVRYSVQPSVTAALHYPLKH